jgi:ribosome biogenesis GTPase
MLCSYRGSLSATESGFTNLVAVGDLVSVRSDGNRQGVVESVHPRTSILVRPDVFHSHLQQVVVANANQLLVVASWRDPLLWFELIDRYLITAKRYGLSPAICVNKLDLADNRQEVVRAMQPYTQLGYRILFTSALAQEGLGELRDLLRDQVTVLAGLSGVGKSSLLSAAEPRLDLRVGEISDAHREGRHVTTQVSLMPLEDGGYVVDTPGVREFGLSGLRRQELAQYYPEMAIMSHGCRFADCLHLHEPECSIKQAVSDGSISRTRYENYTKIIQDLPRSRS